MCVKTDEPTFQELLQEFMNEPEAPVAGPCNTSDEELDEKLEQYQDRNL